MSNYPDNKQGSFIPLQDLPLLTEADDREARYMEGAKHGCFLSPVLIAESEILDANPLQK